MTRTEITAKCLDPVRAADLFFIWWGTRDPLEVEPDDVKQWWRERTTFGTSSIAFDLAYEEIVNRIENIL